MCTRRRSCSPSGVQRRLTSIFDSYVEKPDVTDSEDSGLEDDEGCVCDTLLDAKLKFKTIPGLGRRPQIIKLRSCNMSLQILNSNPPDQRLLPIQATTSS